MEILKKRYITDLKKFSSFHTFTHKQKQAKTQKYISATKFHCVYVCLKKSQYYQIKILFSWKVRGIPSF